MKPANPNAVIAAARSWIGTPYHDQASCKQVGCDCLGLARGIWRDIVGPEPFPIPPYSRDWGERGKVEIMAQAATKHMVSLPLDELRPGALMMFRMRAGAIAKHCAILTGDNTMIHAYDRLGVIEEPFSPAWRRRLTFAFLYPRRRPTASNAGTSGLDILNCGGRHPQQILPDRSN